MPRPKSNISRCVDFRRGRGGIAVRTRAPRVRTAPARTARSCSSGYARCNPASAPAPGGCPDDLFEKRRGGTTVSLSDRGRKNFEGGRAARARGRAPRMARRRIALDARTPSPSWCTCSRSPWWPISALRLRTRAYPLPPRATHLVLGAGAVGQQPTNRPKYLRMSASVVALAVALQIDMRWSPCTAASEADGGEPPPSPRSGHSRHARGRRPRRRVRRSSRQAFLR